MIFFLVNDFVDHSGLYRPHAFVTRTHKPNIRRMRRMRSHDLLPASKSNMITLYTMLVPVLNKIADYTQLSYLNETAKMAKLE